MKSEEQIKELSFKRYGTNPFSFSGQRDGFIEGYKMCQEEVNNKKVCEHSFISCGTKAVECVKCDSVFKTS